MSTRKQGGQAGQDELLLPAVDLGRVEQFSLRFIRKWGLRRYVELSVAITIGGSVLCALPGIPIFGLQGWLLVLMFAFVIGISALVATPNIRSVGKLILHLDQVSQQLAAAASTDHLTGIRNRRGFYEAVAKMPSSPDRELTVLLLDIDRFKHLNDTEGHAVGDEGLVVVADWLASIAGPDGIVARMGGDEFVAVSDSASLVNLPDRWNFLVDQVAFSASLGKASYFTAAGPSIDSAMVDADQTMYQVKEARKKLRNRGRSVAGQRASG